jgi:hypothetical protein
MLPYPGLLGHLLILNGTQPNATDAIMINQVTIRGVRNLEVQGFNNTTLNGTANGVADFPINGGPAGTLTDIDVNNPAFFGDPDALVGGNHTVQIGNRAALTLTGKVTIDYGSGAVKVDAKMNAAAFLFMGNFGDGTGSDTVNVHDSLNGQLSLTAGTGPSNFTLNNDTAASVTTTQPGSASNTLNLTNNTTKPPTGTAALGVVSNTLGTGNNTINVVNNILGQDTIVAGAKTAGAQGKNIVVINTDTITGPSLSLDVENQAGELGNGPAGRGPQAGAVSHIILSSVTFTSGGSLTTTVADGPFY